MSLTPFNSAPAIISHTPKTIFSTAILAMFLLVLLAACDAGAPAAVPTPVLPPTPTAEPPAPTTPPLPTSTPAPPATPTPSPIPASIRATTYIPNLCYHHVRDFRKSDTANDKGYIVPPAKFEATLKYLKSEGYHSVTSQQVYDFYANGKPLPDKPIVLSFDDNDGTQYTNALPLLKKYGFNATFFIMTVTIDKENYMTSEQLKELDKAGYDLQPHTWDHHMVTKYKTEEDWQRQIVEPKKALEDLLGHPAPFFAYPFGIYSAEAAEKLKSYGYKAAFRLNTDMDDPKGPRTDPLFAIKRYIANPFFTQEQLELVLRGDW